MWPHDWSVPVESTTGLKDGIAAPDAVVTGCGQRSSIFAVVACFLLLAVAECRIAARTYQPTWDSIDKRPTPAWFTDAKFGIIIH